VSSNRTPLCSSFRLKLLPNDRWLGSRVDDDLASRDPCDEVSDSSPQGSRVLGMKLKSAGSRGGRGLGRALDVTA